MRLDFADLNLGTPFELSQLELERLSATALTYGVFALFDRSSSGTYTPELLGSFNNGLVTELSKYLGQGHKYFNFVSTHDDKITFEYFCHQYHTLCMQNKQPHPKTLLGCSHAM
jgi:hypothetical protein